MRKLTGSRRRKKKEKPKGFLGEVGFDEGYDDIEKGKKNFKGKLTEMSHNMTVLIVIVFKVIKKNMFLMMNLKERV